MHNCRRWLIQIEGTVQGVGFRPFIYKLARNLNLSGHVYNHSDGVTLEAQGEASALESLEKRILAEAPPLAHIISMRHDEIECGTDNSFAIVESEKREGGLTLISPDVAPCEDCLREMSDPSDRRFSYPFINCTNCGPRFSIIKSLPYDRPATTMKEFKMCESCAKEYADPNDRRFHAQPTACPKCGPRVIFRSRVNTESDEICGTEAIAKAVDFIASGRIVAIKGLGGYHLACDAANDDAVMKLRERKKRDEKPFAIMVADIESAKTICAVSQEEERLILSPQRPIVLLRKKPYNKISKYVAPQNKNLGVMLPSTPLHHLLFQKYQSAVTNNESPVTSHQSRVTSHESPVTAVSGSPMKSLGDDNAEVIPAALSGDPLSTVHESPFTSHQSRFLIMTSGNLTDEPIACKDDDATERLSEIADAFLLHDREIHIRIDDSIARGMSGSTVLMRRARGYAPAPVRLSLEMPAALACGADLKNSICVTSGKNAFLSQHIGDLANFEANKGFVETSMHLIKTLGITPSILAIDAHPQYHSSLEGKKLFPNARVVEVQHHHAHIASCMAENQLPNMDVIGIAIDGTGYGYDGTIWGGEIFIASYEKFERTASLALVSMPGGDAAAKEPWRMALAYLAKAEIKEIPTSLLAAAAPHQIEFVEKMIRSDISCPKSSSLGRLFDAVAALIGIRFVNAFEGQAAMELEQIADISEEKSYTFSIEEDAKIKRIDFSPMIREICLDIRNEVPAPTISMKFHRTAASALVGMAGLARQRSNAVCLSGGSFQNEILLSLVKKMLVDEGFAVYTHSLVPPNDGGIALGQAAIAAHVNS